MIQPGKGSLHDPAFGQYLEAVLLPALDHLQRSAKHGFAPVDELARIATIDKDELEMLEVHKQAHQKRPGAHPILDAGRIHHYRQQQSQCVYGYVALAPLVFLPAS